MDEKEEIKKEEVKEASVETKAKYNPKIFIIGAVGVLVVLGAGYYFAKNKPSSSSSELSTTTQVVPQPTDSAVVEGGVKNFMINGGGFYFKPATIKVKKGDKVKINFVDDDGMHDLVIDAFNVKIGPIKEGSASGEFVADKAGTFQYYCSITGHKEKGMVGSLIVE